LNNNQVAYIIIQFTWIEISFIEFMIIIIAQNLLLKFSNFRSKHMTLINLTKVMKNQF